MKSSTTHYLSSVEDFQELLAGSASGNRLLDGTVGLSLCSEQLLSSEGLGVGVESEENSLVSEGVLLLGEGSYVSSVWSIVESQNLDSRL